ncbi:hypothetical protein GY45DRAFT_250485 [Cubamyces sp. BRFM 1775]|nr:hypothetical protein GY45DRAFT_250485 [Cubamyces sp. BRFM 1775]
MPAVLPLTEEFADVLRADSLNGPYYGLPHANVRQEQGKSELEILSQNALKNSTVPVNRLPPELLVEIMSWTQYPCYSDCRDSLFWLATLLVCRHWFVVGATSPSLWRWVFATPSLNYMRTALARSKQATITFSPGAFYLGEGLMMIAPHAHRIGELLLYEVSSADQGMVQLLMRNSMPRLQVLHVNIWQLRGHPPTDLAAHQGLSFTPDRFPALRSLSLGSCRLSYSNIWSQLHTLRLRELRQTAAGWTLDDITQAVRGCENIVRLELIDVSTVARSHTPTHPPHEDVVPLSKLRNLCIKMRPWEVRHILSAVLIPKTANVMIDWTKDDQSSEDDIASGLAATLPSDLGCLPILLSDSMIEAVVMLQRSRRSVTIYHVEGPPAPSQNVELKRNYAPPWITITFNDFGDTPRTDTLHVDDIAAIAHRLPLETLQIKLDASKANHIDWNALLRPFPALRVFTVRVCAEPHHHMIAFSSRGLFSTLDAQDTERAGLVLCPALQSLKIDGFELSTAELRGDLEHARECLLRRGFVFGKPSRALEELVLVANHCSTQQCFNEGKERVFEELSAVVGSLVYQRDECDISDTRSLQHFDVPPSPSDHVRASATSQVGVTMKRILCVVFESVSGLFCR